MISRRPLLMTGFLVLLSLSCTANSQTDAKQPQLLEIPFPDLAGLESGVREALDGAKLEFEQRVGELSGDELAQFYGQLGMLYHAHHLLDPAETCYRNANALNPNDSRWFHLLGLTLEDKGNIEEANLAYERTLVLNEKYVPARLHIAANMLALGRFPEAEERYAKLAESYPEQAAVLAGRGRLASNRGESEKAVEYFQKALAAEPEATQLHYLLAVEYRKLGDREKAQTHAKLRGTRTPLIPDPLAAAMASLSRSSQYYLEVGYRAFRQGNHDAAVKAFETAIEVNPTNGAGYLSLGRAYSLLGHYDSAKRYFQKAIELSPDHAVANYRLGTVLEHENQDRAAIEHYHKAVTTDPGYFEARLLLANTLMRVGRFQEAATHYAQAHRPGSEPTLFLYREGLAYLAAGQCIRAAGPLEKALAGNPSSGEVLEALSRTYATCIGTSPADRKRALELAKRLYEAVPDAQRAETMAMACAANGLHQEAVEYQTQSAFEALKQGTLEQRPNITENLERYRAGETAKRAWPPGDAVFAPRRFNLEDQSSELGPDRS